MKSFPISALHEIELWSKIKEDWMDETCRTHDRDEMPTEF
jgi:hypothetical protein